MASKDSKKVSFKRVDAAIPTTPSAQRANEHGSVVCICGDYRSQHNDNRECRICGSNKAPYDGCQRFIYARSL